VFLPLAILDNVSLALGGLLADITSAFANPAPLHAVVSESSFLISAGFGELQHPLGHYASRSTKHIGDRPQMRSIFVGEKCNGFAWSSGTASAANTVDVRLWRLREIWFCQASLQGRGGYTYY